MNPNSGDPAPIRSDDFKQWPVSFKDVDLRKELSVKISKRVKSSFIYPIAQLEEIFGDLWGEFKDEKEPLTPEEQKMFDLFCRWRKSVLDYGNREIRLAENDIYKTLR